MVENGRNIVAFVKGNGNTKERPLGFAAHMDQIEPCRNVNPVINGNIISTDKTTTLGGDDEAANFSNHGSGRRYH